MTRQDKTRQTVKCAVVLTRSIPFSIFIILLFPAPFWPIMVTFWPNQYDYCEYLYEYEYGMRIHHEGDKSRLGSLFETSLERQRCQESYGQYTDSQRNFCWTFLRGMGNVQNTCFWLNVLIWPVPCIIFYKRSSKYDHS